MNKRNQQAMTENQKIQFSKYNSNLLREKLLLNEKMIFQHYFEREYNTLKEKYPHQWERFFNQNLSNISRVLFSIIFSNSQWTYPKSMM